MPQRRPEPKAQWRTAMLGALLTLMGCGGNVASGSASELNESAQALQPAKAVAPSKQELARSAATSSW